MTATPIDLTQILLSIIALIGTILGIVIPVWLNRKMNDKQAAATLANAIVNGVGKMQQTAVDAVTVLNPQVNIPGITPKMAAGVQYVLDHAGDEAKRFGITPEAIADKLDAKIGLVNIATNQAVAAAQATPALPTIDVTTKTTGLLP